MTTEGTDTSHNSGWKQVEDGSFQGPVMPDFTTPDFAKFAERSRASWDLGEYLKTLISQYREKRNSKRSKRH